MNAGHWEHFAAFFNQPNANRASVRLDLSLKLWHNLFQCISMGWHDGCWLPLFSSTTIDFVGHLILVSIGLFDFRIATAICPKSSYTHSHTHQCTYNCVCVCGGMRQPPLRAIRVHMKYAFHMQNYQNNQPQKRRDKFISQIMHRSHSG